MKKVFLLIIYLLSLSFICKAEKGGEQGYLAITFRVTHLFALLATTLTKAN